MIRRGGKRVRDYIRYKRKVHSLAEETENTQASVEDGVPDENTESSLNADEPILSVSMWSVTRPPTNLQPAQTVHDIKCFPANQEASSSSVTADSNDVITSTTEIPAELQEISSASETNTLNNITGNGNKRRMEEEISDDNYSSDSMGFNKRAKFYDEDHDYEEEEEEEVEDEEEYDNEDYNDDDYCDDDDYEDDDDDVDIDDADDDFDVDYESCYANTNKRSKRAIEEKGKEVLRNELRNNSGSRSVYINKFTPFAKSKVDKGKGVLRHEESSRIGEGSSVSHEYNTANITKLPEEIDREIFRPGPEEQNKLEWSLNHVFFEGLEIFGEDSDSELSECCDACMIEIDHSKQIS
jgi:hypothetical protein